MATRREDIGGQIDWEIDGTVLDPSRDRVHAHYMGKWEDSDIQTFPKGFAFSLSHQGFLSLISDWYQNLILEEKGDIDYQKGQCALADLLRKEGYPCLHSLWNTKRRAFAESILHDCVDDLLGLVHTTCHEWKRDNYFVEELDKVLLTEDIIQFEGGCLFVPDYLHMKLENLLENLRRPCHYEDLDWVEVLIQSLDALKHGGPHAVSAVPDVKRLLAHPHPRVWESAKCTLQKLEDCI